ncbi:MAG TPA: hypothetical protein VH092_06495 [Urbifossiella sp.]|jgi:hypothetical protein|nr:hypothetical protein [Urbifossiella sp.]
MHDPLTLPDNRSVRVAAADQLGRVYRHGRLLRRLLKLLDDADRAGLHLTTAAQLPMPDAQKGVARG